MSIELYNAYNEDAYADMFDTNVNYFTSNGLGTTRFATGKEDYKNFNKGVFKAKKNHITILHLYEVGQWVFVHQRSKIYSSTVEASVGYRVVNDKITDIMVIGEYEIK